MNLTNKNLCEREKKVLSSIQKLPYCPIAIKNGQGSLLYDYDGMNILTFYLVHHLQILVMVMKKS